MKKVFGFMIMLATLAGCTYYDYYRGDIRYTQDGTDCIYAANEGGRHFIDKIDSLDSEKKIVYRNTLCSDLYARDNGNVKRDERKIVSMAKDVDVSTSNMTVIKRRYIIVPAAM